MGPVANKDGQQLVTQFPLQSHVDVYVHITTVKLNNQLEAVLRAFAGARIRRGVISAG